TRTATGGDFRYRYAGPLRVEETWADGSTYRYGYDALGRLAFVINPVGERYWIERNATGKPISGATFSGIRGRYEWSPAGKLTRAELEGGPSKRFEYDASGRIARREDGELVTTFEYDALGLIQRASRGPVELLLQRDPLGRVVREEQRLGGF